MSGYRNKIKFSQQKEILKLVIVNDFKSPEETLEYLVRFCKNVEELFKRKSA